MEVKVENLTKYYGDNCAVDNISFTIKAGKVLSIIGRNGSGKTSTIRMILGILAKDGGSVEVDGKKIEDCLNNIGYLSEERGLYQKDTVIEQLSFFASLKGISKEMFKESSEYWLNKMDLKKYQNRKLETLSKGNQQKVQLIASVIHNPEVVILDEPFSGLDPVNAQVFIEFIKELKETNKAILLSSHQLGLIEDICDEIIIISNSKIIYQGGIKKLIKDYESSQILIRTQSDIINLSKYKDAIEKIDNNTYLLDSCECVNQVIKDMINNNIEIEMITKRQKQLQEIFIEMVGD